LLAYDEQKSIQIFTALRHTAPHGTSLDVSLVPHAHYYRYGLINKKSIKMKQPTNERLCGDRTKR